MAKVDVELKWGAPLKSAKRCYVTESKKALMELLKKDKVELYKHQIEKIKTNSLLNVDTKEGEVSLLVLSSKNNKEETVGYLAPSLYSMARDLICRAVTDSQRPLSLRAEAKINKEILRGLACGIKMFLYSFANSKKISLYASKVHKKELEQGLELAEAVNQARHLVNLPANKLDPAEYVKVIKKTFSKDSAFSLKVLDSKTLKKEGYGLISAVGQGAETGPYIVHLSYKATGAKKNLVGIGKGVTFDTGGLDLKPSQYMRWMKKDMGGSASLFGLALWTKNFKPKVNLDFIFCIAENAVSLKAFRPGDLIEAQNGVQVEVDNTDAEGRLVMASGYNYAKTLKKKIDVIFNIATLTGAIKHGLDERVGGLFSNDLKLAQGLQEKSVEMGDPLWTMPIPYWTRKKLKTSAIADYVNSTSGYGGALSAAEFLRIFVPESTPWFHLDLYCWTDSARGTFKSKGATGQSVQALAEWVKTYS